MNPLNPNTTPFLTNRTAQVYPAVQAGRALLAVNVRANDAFTTEDVARVLNLSKPDAESALRAAGVPAVAVLLAEGNPARDGGADDGTRSAAWNAEAVATFLHARGFNVVIT